MNDKFYRQGYASCIRDYLNFGSVFCKKYIDENEECSLQDTMFCKGYSMAFEDIVLREIKL